ncbi:MAG: SHOCT domain-containing protein [Elusimicrobia bacterium]|nr:SHOCT domain-containing protein [Elusimicrobiota bacterium]
MENDNKGINVKRGLTTKAEMGWYPTVAPVGYLNDIPNRKGQREIKTDPERFDLVRKMFDMMLTGAYTPPQILKIATDKWCFRMRSGKPMGRSTLYRIFTDSFYYGMYEYPKGSGNWHQGKHRHMITVLEYDRIQILLGRGGKPRPKSHFFTFSGMVRCGECGSTITSDEKIQVICSKCKFKFSAKHKKICPKCNTPIEEMKKPVILRYVYHSCSRGKKPTCSQKYWIREEMLEKQLVEILCRIEIPEEFHNWAMKHLRSENKEESAGRNNILANVKKQYTDCLKKIDGLIEMRANGEITEEEFARKKESLAKDKFRLQELFNDMDNRVDKWLDAAEQVFNFARNAKMRFETGDMETKRQILAALGSNLTLIDKSLTVKIEKPLILVEKISSAVKSIFSTFEPNKNPQQSGDLDTIFAKSPEILRR